MAGNQKFLFDTSFDAGPEEQAAAPKKPPEPTYRAADLAKADEDGFARGHAEGAKEVLGGIEQAARLALEDVGKQLRALFDAVEAESAGHEAAALDLALRVVGKLMPEMERRHGSAEIEAILRDCLECRRGEPRLVIRTSDAVHELVRGCTEELSQELGFEGRLVFLTDEGLGPSDVRVEWADGGVERSVKAVRADVEEILASAFEGAPGQSAASAGSSVTDREALLEPDHPQGGQAEPGPPPSEDTIVGAQEPPLKQEPFHE